MACFKVVPAVNQIETNLYCQRSLERSWMDKKSVAHMAYAPLGQGNRNEMFGGPAVRALAEKYGKTPAQILLRFLTQKSIAVIPRSTKPEHIREKFALFDFTLTPDEMAQLSALDRKEPLIGKPETGVGGVFTDVVTNPRPKHNAAAQSVGGCGYLSPRFFLCPAF